MSLDKDPLYWSKIILGVNYKKSNKPFKNIIESDYSIKNTVIEIERIYRSLLELH